ncbi:phospholipase D-like domain-containing protein DpdK [Paenibacillus lautus]|uniref:Phospholipase D-like domain-containing protein n=1 Tax=Paenibacillus lautus TaxID=1401 RepID=A0A385TR66_PAELA|nr:phospholipase D-like domain-containing protein DpdK [Paenibacillus lautus]AYB46269.1 hypothetical protein D5F53_24540 [Paenibacillus lautus]
MHNRIIRTTEGSVTLKDLLASLLIAECVNPGEELYLISPYLSNVPLIDNRLGNYGDLFPFVSGRTIYLGDILQTLARKGTSVRIICDPERSESRSFYMQLRGDADFRVLEDNHEKGLFSQHFYMHGSMNFTYRGVHVNKENIRTTRLPSEIWSALIAARERWQEAVPYER